MFRFNKAGQLALGLAISSLLLSGCSEEQAPVAIKPVVQPALVEVVAFQAEQNLSFNGVIRAAERADLSFRTSGLITNILVNEGDAVKKDQLLAQLDDRDAKTALASATLEFQDARDALGRGKAVFKKSKAISQSDLDTLTMQYSLAKNAVANARRNLEYTSMTAPFDGIIGRKWVESHSQITANTPALTLHNLSDLEVVINLPYQVMLSGLNTTNAEAELTAFPDRTFPLTLRSYATDPDPVSQTYAVVLGINKVDGIRILPGMAVKVTPTVNIDAKAEKKSISVPLTAIVSNNTGSQFVWVVNKDNRVEQRIVTLGTLLKDRAVINSGLQAGERIIIAGASSLTKDVEVQPYTEKTGE